MDAVRTYISAKRKLMISFGCEQDYFIKPLAGCKWGVSEDSGLFILSYVTDDGVQNNAVVVKKADAPMIYESDDFTMVIAIDCIKTAFIFENDCKG